MHIYINFRISAAISTEEKEEGGEEREWESCQEIDYNCFDFINQFQRINILILSLQGPSILLQMAECPFSWERKKKYIYIYLSSSSMHHASIYGHWGCFHMLAVVNSVSVNFGVILSLWCLVLISFGYTSRSRLAGWYSRSIFTFFEELSYYFP